MLKQQTMNESNGRFSITHIGGAQDEYKLSLPMRFIHIPAKGKSFQFQESDMTESESEQGTLITFDADYWLCAYPCTQEFWELVVNYSKTNLNANPSYFKGYKRPVEYVSWNEVQLFNNTLNNLMKEDSKRKEKLIRIEYENQGSILRGNFGLPSETQWEYVALAGGHNMFAGSDNLNEVGWYDQNSHDKTMPVGLKQPNAFGLYDMSGNVWEWCADNYKKDVTKLPKNGTSLPNKKDDFKSLRGGSFFYYAQYCRSRNHGKNHPGNRGDIIGFRLLFSLSSENEG